MFVHHPPVLTPNARILLAVALFGLLAVTVEFLAVLDLSGATCGMSDLFVWCLWVGAAPVACALTFLIVQRSMTTPP
jgi:hypothetical protein